MFQKPDFHIHSTASDGSDSPYALLGLLREAEIDVFSLTDHDSIEGCREIIGHLSPEDPKFLPGVEFSCEKAGGKYHILGYGFQMDSPALREVMEFTHQERVRKLWDRLAFLEDQGYPFPSREKEALAALETPGKPHLVAHMLDLGYISSPREGYGILSKYHGRDVLISPERAIAAILAAGGIPVLAHGILGGGSLNLSREDVEHRVLPLKQAGLMGLECYYSTYTPEQEDIMLRIAQEQDLLITAGSDYHGSNKKVRLGQIGTPDLELLKPFYLAITDKII